MIVQRLKIQKRKERGLTWTTLSNFSYINIQKKVTKPIKRTKKKYKKKKVRTNHDGVLEFSVHLKKQILMLKGTT